MTSRSPRTIADRVAGAAPRVVGRGSETDRFAALLRAGAPPAVLFVHGPGGVGKTALLREFTRLADAADRPVVRLDAADFERSPAGLIAALGSAAGAAPGATLADLTPPEAVVMIDRLEQLAPLTGWFWRTLVPGLAADVLVVAAGRIPPPHDLVDDVGLTDLVTSLPLRNLPPTASRDLLVSLGLPEHELDDLVTASHGHPLALVIVADLHTAGGATRGPDRPSALLRHPDASTRLLGRFVDDGVTPLQRRALHLCGHARRVDRTMLGRVLELSDADADSMLDWLRERPYAESHPDGLSVHDIVRDALDSDLRWRDHDAFVDLHGRIRAVVVDRITRASGAVQQRAAQDLLFLHRGNPLSRTLYALDHLGTIANRAATEADLPRIVEMFGSLESPQRAGAAAQWWSRQPENVHVQEAADGSVVGAVVMARLDVESDRVAVVDPVAAAAWAELQARRPPEPGEVVVHQFIIDALDPGEIGPVADMVGVVSLTQWTVQRLGWVVLSSTFEEGWAPLWSYLGFEPIGVVEAEAAGRRVGLWARDFGRSPYGEWLERMAAQELSDVGDQHPPIVSPIALSRPDFGDAVRQLLKDFHHPDRLDRNPLAGSRMVPDDAHRRIPEVLRARARRALGDLAADPKLESPLRAVERTYLRGTTTQEAAAEVLGLPFSTYRRHLATGTDRLTDLLWHWEVHGAPDPADN